MNPVDSKLKSRFVKLQVGSIIYISYYRIISWEQRKLGELAVEVKRKAEKDSDAPVMMISAAEGFIDQSQRYSNNNAGSSLKNYTLLYEGELAYNHGYSKFRNFGSVFDLRVEKARIPFVYHSFALPEDDHRFYAYYLNSGLFDGELKKLVSSTARMDGLLNISYEDYMSIPVLRPPVKEQEKIGRFLTSLDDLITLHQREYFPFLFGSDSAKIVQKTISWEQRKLENITLLITKGTTPKDKSGEGEVNFIKVENIDPSSGEITSCSHISLEEHDGYLKRSQLKENDILGDLPLMITLRVGSRAIKPSSTASRIAPLS